MYSKHTGHSNIAVSFSSLDTSMSVLAAVPVEKLSVQEMPPNVGLPRFWFMLYDRHRQLQQTHSIKHVNLTDIFF